MEVLVIRMNRLWPYIYYKVFGKYSKKACFEYIFISDGIYLGHMKQYVRVLRAGNLLIVGNWSICKKIIFPDTPLLLFIK